MVKTGTVTPYWNNPRVNEEAVSFVVASVKEFGWRQPIVVDDEMVVIAGHTRLKAAEAMGHDEVPVHVASDLSADQVRAYRIADNRVAEMSNWNWETLSVEAKEMELGLDPAIFAIAFDTGLLSQMKVMLADEFPPLPYGDGNAEHGDPLAVSIIIGEPAYKDDVVSECRQMMEAHPEWSARFK
jgi:hypothetical protein